MVIMGSSKLHFTASMANIMYTNAAYFPNNRIYQGDTPGMLNYSCINLVYYAYANVSMDGSVFLSDEWADALAPVDGVQGGLGSLMHLKQKHPHLQVVLSIGGRSASDVFPYVAANTLCRDNFARSALGLVEASGLDGIDVAWEYPHDAQQAHNFLSLLRAIRVHLPDDRFLLSASLPASCDILQFIDFKAAGEYLNYINLRAYDFFGPWSSRSGYHAQLYAMDKNETSGSSGVAYLMSHGFPAKGIILGIPTHGRNFRGVAGPGYQYREGGADDGAVEYKKLPGKEAEETVDKRHVAAHCITSDGSVVTYDNVETVQLKAAFCKQKRLGGLFYWNAPADSIEKSQSLIEAGFRALHTS